MKFSFLLVSLAFVSVASAEPQDREKWLSICSDLSRMGGEIMEARQKGISRESVMDVADGDRKMQTLIELAYESERVSTESERQAIASEFEKSLYQRCSDAAPFK